VLFTLLKFLSGSGGGALKHSRTAFITGAAGAFASVGIIRSAARAADFTLKFGLDQPVTHPTGARAVEAAENIGRESGGRIAVQVFLDNALGNSTSMLSQVRSGAIAFFICPGTIVANVVPVAAMESVAFAFKTIPQAMDALDGPFGANIRAAIVNAGLFTFDKYWCGGFHQIINGVRPVLTPADLKGLKLRVPPAPLETGMFKALDSPPQPINMAETYVALQTHVVDGAALPLVTMESYKLYEVQKYLSFTNHLFTSYTPLANADAMASLPKDLRDVVVRNFNAAALRQRGDFVNLDVKLETTLKGQGLIPNHPELAPFRAAVQQAGLYKTWSDQFGPQAWALLEKSSGTFG
jgi:TRAP-type transport system periplasmic protein